MLGSRSKFKGQDPPTHKRPSREGVCQRNEPVIVESIRVRVERPPRFGDPLGLFLRCNNGYLPTIFRTKGGLLVAGGCYEAQPDFAIYAGTGTYGGGTGAGGGGSGSAFSLPTLGKPTCLQVFLAALTHPESGPIGDKISQYQENAQAALGAAAATASVGASTSFNAALQRGAQLASGALASGGVSYALRSPVVRSLLSFSNKLTTFAEQATAEEVVGEAGLVGVDLYLLNAVLAERNAVKEGKCISEASALKTIATGGP